MAVRVTDKTEKSKILTQAVGIHRSLGVSFHEVLDERGRRGLTVRGEQISEKFRDLHLNIWDKDDYLGFNLVGGNNPGTQFNLGSDSSRTAASFAHINGGIWLLHDGNVYLGLFRPDWQDSIAIGGKSHAKIAHIYDPSFIEKIFLFHLSRFGNDIQEPETPPLSAMDKGPLRGGIRSAVVFEARQSHIVEALLAKIEAFSWKVSAPSGSSKPDLVVERDEQKVLFEVKSASDGHSLLCAVGQCLVYNLDYNASRKIIIALEAGDIERSWAVQRIAESNLGIEIVFVKQDQSSNCYEFQFSESDPLISTMSSP